MTATQYVGKPVSRVDGRAKVTGAAKYAGEFNVPRLTYGVIVSSTVAKGRITRIDATAALALEGVIEVLTHENTPRLAWLDRSYQDQIAPNGSPFRPLHDDKVVYSGQPVALVVAENFELARYAASLVRVEYAPEPHQTNFDDAMAEAYEPPTGRAGYTPPPKPRGEADQAFADAKYQVSAQYATPTEHHNPMENYATTVAYGEEGKLTVYDKTQGAQNVQAYLASVFSMSSDDVRVISPFVGGGFGSGLRPVYNVFLAVLAARQLKRSVRVSLTRQQMFTFSHRSETRQEVRLGAARDGQLEAIIHEAFADTSTFEDFAEGIVNWSGLLHQCDNVRLEYRIAPMDVYTPADMRAPGATQGTFALECAVDELAHRLGMDPLEFRLKNYAERDQNLDKPFSSKELRECYRQGAERFGWSQRNLEPRSMRRGNRLIGWGMSTGAWEAMQDKAGAKATLHVDGRLIVGSATADIGTGTYTIMTQIAAETLGIPLERVEFQLGDSTLPFSPVEGGSWTAASVGTAVKEVCEALREKLFKLAGKIHDSPLGDATLEDVVFENGEVRLHRDSARGIALTEILRRSDMATLDEEVTAKPKMLEQSGYSRHSHQVTFVEVEVEEDIGMVRVTRVVDAVAGGRILNPKTARSQILGGVVWGISMALHEETLSDHAFGRFMNHNLAEYHIPVNKDIPEIDVIFVHEDDTIVNPLGAKGLGEIGLVGTAAAVANAVFHATGKRVRHLPVTLDKLL